MIFGEADIPHVVLTDEDWSKIRQLSERRYPN